LVCADEALDQQPLKGRSSERGSSEDEVEDEEPVEQSENESDEGGKRHAGDFQKM